MIGKYFLSHIHKMLKNRNTSARSNNKGDYRAIIALTLTAPRWSKSKTYKVYKYVVEHYTGLKPTHVITHCEEERKENIEAPVFCINEHPSSAMAYFKYIVYSIGYIIGIILSRKILKERHKCILVLWGPIFLPIQLLFRPFCNIYLIVLGEWNKVLYWKVYHRYGRKTAKAIEALVSLVELLAAVLSDRIITNTYRVAVRLLRYARGEVDLRLQPIPKLFYSHVKHDSSRNTIAYIGRLDYEKGILIALIGYMKYLRQTSSNGITPLVMEIAGTGPLRELVEALTQRVKYIRYRGFLDSKNLSLLYLKTFVLIIPSYTEGLPNVIIEAVMFRVPYVVVNRHIWDNIRTITGLAKKRGVNIVLFSDANELGSILYNLTLKSLVHGG